MKQFIIFTSFIIYISITAYAEIRFVSKTGTSKPPYTSWATAADRIQNAIDISKRGDTIYVGNGTYVDTVRMTPGIALIGSGMDSCIINSQPFAYLSGFHTVDVNDSCIFSGFQIIVSNDGTGSGIALMQMGTNSIVKYNKVTNAAYAVNIDDSSPIVRHNFLYPETEAGFGVSIVGGGYGYFPQIDSNLISVKNGYAILIHFGTKSTIRANTFYIVGRVGRAFSGGGADTAKFINNLIICDNCDFPIVNAISPTYTRNNIIIGKTTYAGIWGNSKNIIENNSVTGGLKFGLTIGTGEPIYRYNNVWGNRINFDGFIPDSTNISVDPMFVNADSMDFHLQKCSPLINAGNPAIRNVDGTRSDIGIYGGPFGESYLYKDLAPHSPKNLILSLSGDTLLLNWSRNTESDFSYYNIYRDTTKGFLPNKSKLISKTKDTTYSENSISGKERFYKLTAVDLKGNESAPGEEAGIITDVNDRKIITTDFLLYQNYPNPFNPATRIGYRIKTAGYIKINVYDIKGELIKTIENRYANAGFYEVEFDIAGMDLSSGVYFYKIDVKSINNIPLYTEIKKMVLIK